MRHYFKMQGHATACRDSRPRVAQRPPRPSAARPSWPAGRGPNLVLPLTAYAEGANFFFPPSHPHHRLFLSGSSRRVTFREGRNQQPNNLISTGGAHPLMRTMRGPCPAPSLVLAGLALVNSYLILDGGRASTHAPSARATPRQPGAAVVHITAISLLT